LPKVDGVSKTSYLTVRYLQQSGREVLIFAPDTSVKEVYGSEVVGVPSFPLAVAPETQVAIPNAAVEARLRSFKPDLIHLGSPAILSAYGMMLGRELNVPIVANYQTDLPGYAAHYGAPALEAPTRAWLRYVHNGCHINLVPTRTVQNELKAYGFKRLRLWGRGVNLRHFSPDHRTHAMRQRLLNGQSDDTLLCVYVGRLANEKQVELLVETARLDGVAVAIVGDGYMREALEERFKGTNVYFTGYLVGQELAEAYASADAFFFTGGNETFGQVAQEAMASGLPCVVTRLGSVSELVQDGVTGFVVDHHPHAFANAARTLRDNRPLRDNMARNALTFAQTRPWSAIMRQLEGHYNEALTLNARFKARFGWTHYHRTARWRSRFIVAGVRIANALMKLR
jgi:glycosyltransferase involved in cell wall biosynthesis